MNKNLELSASGGKSVYRYNFFLFWSMVICIIIALVNLFIFPSKKEISKTSDLSIFVGKTVKIYDKTLIFENSDIDVKLNDRIDGYQWVQSFDKSHIYTTTIGGNVVPIISRKLPSNKNIYKVIQVEKSSEDWKTLDLSKIEKDSNAVIQGYVLIHQKNQVSIISFFIAGAFLLILILLIPIRVVQVMIWQKNNPDEFMDYARNVL